MTGIPKLYRDAAKLLEDMDSGIQYILFHPFQNRVVITEIKSMLMLAGALRQKGYAAILWIEPEFCSIDEFQDILYSAAFPDSAVIWLHAPKLGANFLRRICFAFSTRDCNTYESIPSGNVGVFSHTSTFIRKDNCFTFDNLHVDDKLVYGSDLNHGFKLSYLYEATNVIRTNYFFLASTSHCAAVASVLANLEGVLPDAMANTKQYFAVGYLRREVYAIDLEDNPDKPVLLFAPIAVRLNSAADHYKILETLSMNLPDCEIWYRPFPSDKSSEYCLEVQRRCSHLINVVFDDAVQSGDLINVYRKSSILLTDISGSAHSFILATGRPAIQFITPNVHFVSAGCVPVYSYEELAVNSRNMLTDLENCGREAYVELMRYMRPVGDTVKYIVDNIENMVAGKPIYNSIEVDLAGSGRYARCNDYLNLVKILLQDIEAYEFITYSSVKMQDFIYSEGLIVQRIMRFCQLKARACSWDTVEVNSCLDNICHYFIDYINEQDEDNVEVFELGDYLEYIEENLEPELNAQERIQELDGFLSRALEQMQKHGADIQKKFYRFCAKKVAEYPENKVCNSWFYKYLKSSFACWMLEDKVFACCYKVYMIRALGWMGDREGMIREYYALLSMNLALAVKPYWFDGQWNSFELGVFITALLNHSAKWELHEYQLFSQLLLKILGENGSCEQQSRLLEGLLSNNSVFFK